MRIVRRIEPDLVKAAQAGDSKAREELWQLTAQLVRRVLIDIGTDERDDIVMDVCLSVFAERVDPNEPGNTFTKLERIKAPEAYVSWIVKLARWRYADLLRKQEQPMINTGIENIEPPVDTVNHEKELAVEAIALLQEVLETLPIEEQHAIELRLRGENPGVIGSLLGGRPDETEAAQRQRFYRLLRSIRARVLCLAKERGETSLEAFLEKHI